jgi:dipeptidyl aminopeptidase/acylaminoacyl peptidase
MKPLSQYEHKEQRAHRTQKNFYTSHLPSTAPYGTWASPLSAAVVAAGGLRLGVVALDGDDVYWLEGRPREGGRYALVNRTPGGTIADVTPRDMNVRSRVHEYGGDAFLVAGGIVYFSNFADQRVYRLAPGGEAQPITPAGAWFYADFALDARRQRLIAVREDHTDQSREPVNALVSIPLASNESAGDVIASGDDFYSTPRLSPDGSKLAWLSWRHPNMPWDGTELWVADVTAPDALEHHRQIAGGPSESIYQPGWSPDGTLYYVSDRSGYWRLYRSERSEGADRSVEVVRGAPMDAEFGRPQWVFGSASWAFAGPSRLVVSYTCKGRWYLATVDVASGAITDIAPQLMPHDWMTANATHAVLIAGSATGPDAVVRVDLASGVTETLRAASTLTIDAGYISVAEPIEFPTTGSRTAHTFYYAPRNKDVVAPAGERPPLIVISHGGPTSAARASLDLQIQYWTSRGFAVADVNYGGSSGYGRAYRERLNGQWGIVDVDDVINAVRFLAAQGKADDERAVIRGGSAGGYTTLAALTFHPDVFKAGASYYGISDLEVLEVDTHKFESRYSHSLIGPYPAAKEVYYARSPIHAIDRLACPLILFQGLEDKVVPPNQSQMMADAVRARGLPVAYLAFDGEQHGFRKAETIIRSLEAELYFYGAVFGFAPADAIPPVHIDNLP